MIDIKSCVVVLLLWSCACLCPGASTIYFPPNGNVTVTSYQWLPPSSLRGYGTVGGDYWTVRVSGRVGGALVIHGESADKAQLIQSKYLSDISTMGVSTAVSITVRGSATPAVQTGNQGTIACLRLDSDVIIVAGVTPPDAGSIADAALSTTSAVINAPSQTTVPMWLDRFDRFGFRFYYWPFFTPSGATLATYDPLQEFAYAQSIGAGFTFWSSQRQEDTTNGLQFSNWDWGLAAAKNRSLPVGINLTSNPSTYLLNRYRSQTELKMPQFCGNEYSICERGPLGPPGRFSFMAQNANDAEFATIQQAVKRFFSAGNVTTWLEPHGELNHGVQDIMLDYGPIADHHYQRYLQSRYGAPSAVALRWFGDASRLASWNAVHVPEIAHFMGWDPQTAIDLAGTWRIHYENGSPAPSTWLASNFDDSAWATVNAPGDDRAMLMEKAPAIYRRVITVDSSWLAQGNETWLYAWDMSQQISQQGETGLEMGGWVNDVKISLTAGQPDLIQNSNVNPPPHIARWNITSAIHAGSNQITLRLPAGVIAYRMYLSHTPPHRYPNLGSGLNAQWADFSDWFSFTRGNMVRRGMNMIRQVDPNANIELMAPDSFLSDVTTQAEDFGGEIHDTGGMSGNWSDYLPAIARGRGLPFSLEPGSPAPDDPEVHAFFGRWLTEGVDAVDWFIHIGDVVFPEHAVVKAYFDSHLPFIHAIGKSHVPRANLAVLYSSRCPRLTGWPWGYDAVENTHGGYWHLPIEGAFRDAFPFDAVTEMDFSRGNTSQYKVIVDSNTEELDEQQLTDIETWIRAGGTFITFGDTGRNTSSSYNSWPISRLTGYQVIARDIPQTGTARGLSWVPGQSILTNGAWSTQTGVGLSLKATAADCQNLAMWSDGTVAIGSRPLGSGRIIHLGAYDAPAWFGWGFSAKTADILPRLFDSAGAERLPAVLSPNIPYVRYLHTVSNNGLYDVWTIFYEHRPQSDPAITTDLKFSSGNVPAWCIDVGTGASFPITTDSSGSRLANITVSPLDTRMFMTPRVHYEAAPLDWFVLQRTRWKGTAPATSIPLPPLNERATKDLSTEWSFKALSANEDGTPYTATSVDDSVWEKRTFGIWSVDHPGINHGILRKHFTIPSDWSAGKTALWCEASYTQAFLDQSRFFIDGLPVQGWINQWSNGLTNATLNGTLQPGSDHVMVVEVSASAGNSLVGPMGECWLSYQPNSLGSIDLSGPWTPSTDGITNTATVTLPGTLSNVMIADKSFQVDQSLSNRSIFTFINDDLGASPVLAVIINGHWLESVNHASPESVFRANITPWIRFGEINHLQIVPRLGWDGTNHHYQAPTSFRISTVRLDIFDPKDVTDDFAGDSEPVVPAGTNGTTGTASAGTSSTSSPSNLDGGHRTCGFSSGMAGILSLLGILSLYVRGQRGGLFFRDHLRLKQ